jgi:hypothetical protein
MLTISRLNKKLNDLARRTKANICCLTDLIENANSNKGITIVETYDNLPPANLHTDSLFYVVSSLGTWWLPFSLGGTYKPNGFYYSDGVTWTTIDTPFQATQIDVNTGTNDDKFVTPLTLKNSTQWNTKQNTLVSGANIKTFEGDSLLGSGDYTPKPRYERSMLLGGM